MDVPETRYAMSGDVAIAYQIIGDGPFDVVLVPGSPSSMEFVWRYENTARWLTRLGSFCRVLFFDKRGTGHSDRVAGTANLETRMDDVRAVMDAVGSQRAGVIGLSEGGPMSLLFAATYPDRVRALVVYGAMPRFTRTTDFPFGITREQWMRESEMEVRLWGTAELAREWAGPDAGPEDLERSMTVMRLSGSPGAWRALMEMNVDIDVRGVLGSIRVPTMVLHRQEDKVLPIEGARWMARRIPGARMTEHPGGPHAPFQGDWQLWCDEVERFLVPICTGPEPEPEPELMLATILFTDIVDSTTKAVELGDRGWRELLEQHHERIRGQLARFRGVELDTADGFFARFDGPARAIRCACAIRESVAELGLEVRAGLHSGECELLDGKVAGIAVSIGARVAALAGPREVLVSQTVKDLVAGSGIQFAERGIAELKGVPGEWRLFAVAAA